LACETGRLIAEKLLDRRQADQRSGSIDIVGVRLGKDLIPQGF
jgi:hypothetical protein